MKGDKFSRHTQYNYLYKLKGKRGKGRRGRGGVRGGEGGEE